MKTAILSLFATITNPDERNEIIAALQKQKETEEERYYRIKAKIDRKYPTKKQRKPLK